MCVSSEDSPTLTFMSKWKSLVVPLIVELLRVLLLSRHRQHTHRTDIPPCFLTRRQANATALRWTRAPPLHHTSPTKGTCTCVCSLRWKVNILVRNDRSQETENKATPQTESSRVIINVMSTKKKKNSIQFNSVCLQNISKQGWKFTHQSAKEWNVWKVPLFSTWLWHLWLWFWPGGMLSPFSPSTTKHVV